MSILKVFLLCGLISVCSPMGNPFKSSLNPFAAMGNPFKSPLNPLGTRFDPVQTMWNSWFNPFRNKDLNTCDDPDYDKNTHELILSKGYPAVNYTVETPDHYVLGIHRIPNGNGYNGDETKRKVLFLQHGLYGDDSHWVWNFKKSSLGFMAYDRGYDVWMGNFRGNKYSRNNTKISPEDPEFWLFSLDEYALIDLPTMLDFALKTTGQKNLYFAGLSAGPTAILALLSHKPEYQKKVKAGALLGPVATFSNVFGFPLKYYVKYLWPALYINSIVGGGTKGEILQNSAVFGILSKYFCGTRWYQGMCRQLLVNHLTKRPEHVNTTRGCVYMNHFPSGTSSRAFHHYLQEARKQVFQMYDFGRSGNLKKYGQAKPPVYNTTAILKPFGLFASSGDAFVPENDLKFLREQLPNVPVDFVYKDPKFGHIDYLISDLSPKLFFKPMLDMLDKH